MVWQRRKVIRITAYEMSRLPLPKIEGNIGRFRQSFGVARSHVIVDEEGIGGGVVDHCVGVKGFTADATPIQEKATLQKLPSASRDTDL